MRWMSGQLSREARDVAVRDDCIPPGLGIQLACEDRDDRTNACVAGPKELVRASSPCDAGPIGRVVARIAREHDVHVAPGVRTKLRRDVSFVKDPRLCPAQILATGLYCGSPAAARAKPGASAKAMTTNPRRRLTGVTSASARARATLVRGLQLLLPAREGLAIIGRCRSVRFSPLQPSS